MYRNLNRALGEEPMERYETARIDVIQIEEDVITASVDYCSDDWGGDHDDDHIVGWDVFYTDGSHEYIEGSDKPEVCP